MAQKKAVRSAKSSIPEAVRAEDEKKATALVPLKPITIIDRVTLPTRPPSAKFICLFFIKMG